MRDNRLSPGDFSAASGEGLFIFENTPEAKLLVRAGEMKSLPSAREISDFTDIIETCGMAHRSGMSGDMWAELKACARIPDGYEFVGRREAALLFSYDFFVRAGVSFQIMNLHRNNKFCGRCGMPMYEHERERAMSCSCGNIIFPLICPAIIVGVEKDGMLLMGHGVNFQPGMYSVLAGFVEPGETLEQTVEREIYEESGVRVKNIRYFGSQPWPFPSSLMLGFQCDWESGEPVPDGEELDSVRWFRPEEVPLMPQSVSISRQIINDWLRRVS